jgi:hypothetical protein
VAQSSRPDATVMLIAFAPPAIVLLGIKGLVALGASTWLEFAETIDGCVLVLTVAILGIDTTGKLLALAISGWRKWPQRKS